ncbi:type 2 periplasmic-binding domain-containing protein [Methanofollis fontis]|uniref:transporter substrate-binding domain-containing protein n=1 Tax=Methanofollis fontis TaxID=2052832 RepID=UPI001F48147E|nr:transporter substrate-binding domain-containing protein [Methanofollis fontis]
MEENLIETGIIAGKTIKKIGSVFTNEQFGIAVRKDDAELRNKVNNGLDALMVDPCWQELNPEVQHGVIPPGISPFFL